MNIDVNVSEIDLSSVVEHGYDGERVTLADKVASVLADRFSRNPEYAPLRQRVERIRDEEIRAQIAPLITEALEAPVQRTNPWGEPNGEPTPLRDVVVEEARKILNGTQRGGNYEQQQLGQKLIADAVDRSLRKDLGDVIAEERKKVIDAVREKAASIIADAVSKGVGGR